MGWNPISKSSLFPLWLSSYPPKSILKFYTIYTFYTVAPGPERQAIVGD